MKKIFSLVIFVLVFASQWSFAEENSARESCKVCGMYIDQYHDTSCELVKKDGKQFKTCGVACMIRLVNDTGGPDAFTSIMVHAWDNKELLPANKATYVIGSKVIPDMIPNIIAFNSKEAAEEFISREGGKMLDFTQALLSISPMGMTMPVRLKTAVPSPRGDFSIGAGYMLMTMDKVKVGSDTVDPRDFVKRPGQMMGPKEMESRAEMLMLMYSLTDNLSANMTLTYFDKEMERYIKSGKERETTTNSGFGDIGLSFRYNIWKDVYYSKFFSLLAETTIPTGDFDKDFILSPGLQIGTGAFTFTGGLLFSHRIGHFWFHYLSSYTAAYENADEYKFGNITRAGAAIHYTPNYYFMAGLEADANYYEKSEYKGDEVGNTGGFRSYLSPVIDWKFLTALGGNFSIRLTGGIPIYEDMNHFKAGTSEKVQMGRGYFANIMLSFKSRLSLHRDHQD
jgi:nitrous oxide reductase accessory protein NosL